MDMYKYKGQRDVHEQICKVCVILPLSCKSCQCCQYFLNVYLQLF